jgi:hypothetical protein
MAVSPEIRQFAEEADWEQPEPWLPAKLLKRPRYTALLSPNPHHAQITRLRTTAEELDATIAEVRTLLRANGYTGCAWSVGPSCRPVDLAERLVARGFVPAGPPTFEPHFTAMALAGPPRVPASLPGVDAHLVRSLDEYILAMRVGLAAAGETPEAVDQWVAAAGAGWDHPNRIARLSAILRVDGEVAGVGLASYGHRAVLLGGAAVVEKHRGRGGYRALVAARWEAAVAMGKPALTVHAGAMSRPILERCGFETVCELALYADPGLAEGAPAK